MNKILKPLLYILVCEVVGLSAAPFTISAVSGWYAFLNKPTLSPPNWIFGPVWTILYLTMGLSAYLIWERGHDKKGAKTAKFYFFTQLILNFLWSVLFFGFRLPILGFIDILALWIAILLTIINFFKVNRIAAWLLVPYLLWVSFAGFLNFSILVLNH